MFGKAARYKINTEKMVEFLYINNEQSKKEIRKTIPLTIASKNKIHRNKFNEEGENPI
jgi:hypothetical protein